MTTTNFDSHAGDGEALAANGGTSLDLPTSKTPSPRQGHPSKKVKKYGSLNKKGGGGAPQWVRGGVCGGRAWSTAGGGGMALGPTLNRHTDSGTGNGHGTHGPTHSDRQPTETGDAAALAALSCHQDRRPPRAVLTDTADGLRPSLRPNSFGSVRHRDGLDIGRGKHWTHGGRRV